MSRCPTWLRTCELSRQVKRRSASYRRAMKSALECTAIGSGYGTQLSGGSHGCAQGTMGWRRSELFAARSIWFTIEAGAWMTYRFTRTAPCGGLYKTAKVD